MSVIQKRELNYRISSCLMRMLHTNEKQPIEWRREPSAKTETNPPAKHGHRLVKMSK